MTWERTTTSESHSQSPPFSALPFSLQVRVPILLSLPSEGWTTAVHSWLHFIPKCWVLHPCIHSINSQVIIFCHRECKYFFRKGQHFWMKCLTILERNQGQLIDCHFSRPNCLNDIHPSSWMYTWWMFHIHSRHTSAFLDYYYDTCMEIYILFVCAFFEKPLWTYWASRRDLTQII